MQARNDARWLEQFGLFKEYVSENGRFPNSNRTFYKGLDIGQWLHNQVLAYRGGFLPAERKVLLDGFNPAWRGTLRERREEGNRLLLSSALWKKHLTESDVPIDAVLSDTTLAFALSLGIYTCQRYLEQCEQYLRGKGYYDFFDVNRRYPSKVQVLFSRANREAVFETQFPNLSFRHYHLYLDAFGHCPKDLYKTKDIAALGREPSFYEVAAAASAYSKFTSRDEMVAAYDAVLCTLSSREEFLLRGEYFQDTPRADMAKSLGCSVERVRQIICTALPKFQSLARANRICPEHPEDAKRREEEESFFLKRRAQFTKAVCVEQEELLRLPIEALDLSTRSVHCLKNVGIHTLGALICLTPKDLASIHNLGVKSLHDIAERLDKIGFPLTPGAGPARCFVSAPTARRSLNAIMANASARSGIPSGGNPCDMDGPGGR